MHHRHAPVRALATAAAALALMVALAGTAVGQASPAASTTPGSEGSGSLDGTWSVDPSLGSFDYAAQDFSGSWVGYRVQEELVGLGGTFAVGRTPDVSGSITLSGTTLTGADLAADLTTLQSDQSMRDGQLGRQGIETDQFPTATFVLTEPIDLGELPPEGEAVSVEAVGDLTLHGVTRSVAIPLAARWQGDVIGVAGAYTFPWEEFEMERPQSMRVVSLADDVTMEFQVFFRHEGTDLASAEAAGSPAAASPSA
jgi:polyisoprenoid-binding protein YceI